MTPQFKHDCDACRFLGRYHFNGPLSNGATVPIDSDLYVCRGRSVSLIARFSDTGSDYASYDLRVLEPMLDRMRKDPATHDPALIEAYEREYLRT